MENFPTGKENNGESNFKKPETESLKSKENKSKFNFRMLYAAHDSENVYWSTEELEKELQDIDIWFPESAGWNEFARIAQETFATGKYEVPKNIDPVLKSQLEALRRLGKSGKEVGVGFVDLPEGHSLLKDNWVVDPNKVNRAFFDFLNGNFDIAIREVKSFTSETASNQKAREEYMQEHTGLEIDRILQNHPHLQEKLKAEGKLNILMTLGTAHTGVSHNLKKEGYDVERKFKHDLPYIFSPIHEVIRRYRFKKEVDDQLAARVLMQMMVTSELRFLDIEKADQVANKIVRSFSFEDIKKISLEHKTNPNIGIVLKKFNINIPNSEKEADELLSGKKEEIKEKTKSPELKTFRVRVEVNGQYIDTIDAPVGIDDRDLKKLAFRYEPVNKLISGRELKKFQHVKGTDETQIDTVDIQLY